MYYNKEVPMYYNQRIYKLKDGNYTHREVLYSKTGKIAHISGPETPIGFPKTVIAPTPEALLEQLSLMASADMHNHPNILDIIKDLERSKDDIIIQDEYEKSLENQEDDNEKFVNGFRPIHNIRGWISRLNSDFKESESALDRAKAVLEKIKNKKTNWHCLYTYTQREHNELIEVISTYIEYEEDL